MDIDHVWVRYDYDEGPYAITLHLTCEEAVKATAVAGYGKVAKWPLGIELREAITRWESE